MTQPTEVLTRAHDAAFVPISPGVGMRILRMHEGGGMTFLIRMDAGSRAVRHDHPGGEETYVLEGALQITSRIDADGTPRPDLTLAVGDHAYVPPGEVHEGYAATPTLFVVVAPGGVTRT